MSETRPNRAKARPSKAALPADPPVQQWPADAVERRFVADLVPYARNARTHSEAQVAQIAASIREWGWTTPVLIGEDAGIIAGHGRVLAAQSLGINEIPVMVARGWTEAQRRAYVVADNQLALNAGWDNDLLRLELGDLKLGGFDLGVIGLTGRELGALFGTVEAVGSPGRSDSSYSEQYGVIVICRDEAHQQEIYERLSGEGYEAKVVAT
jgi:ParB-like nuclease family protein